MSEPRNPNATPGASIAGTSLDGAFADPPPVPVEAVDAERYERGPRLGGGGMGEVFVARDRKLDREVAIKEARAGADAQLIREARRTASLDHPGIVAVHDSGTTVDGRPFYAMRLVRGRTLSAALTDAPSLDARLKLLKHALDVAHAVAWAHARGQLHLDLKPANVMVGEFGETQVVDWGLGDVAPGRVAGTPAYMSPEQAVGGPYDPRTDVFGLGGILYALLTGRSPRPGSVETAIEAAAHPTIPIRTIEPNAPVELCAIAERALQHDPGQRYATALEFAADLTLYMSGERISAHRYSATELLVRFARAWRGPLVVAAILVTLGIAGTVAFGLRLAAERDRATRGYQQALVAQAGSAARLQDWPGAGSLAAAALALGEVPEARGVLIGADAYAHPRQIGSTPLSGCRSLALADGAAICADGERVWSTDGVAFAAPAFDAQALGDELLLVEPDRLVVTDRAGVELRVYESPTVVGPRLLATARGEVTPIRSTSRNWTLLPGDSAPVFVEDCVDGGSTVTWYAIDPTAPRRVTLCDDGRLLSGPVRGSLTLLAQTPAVGDADGGTSALAIEADRVVIGTNRGDLIVVDGAVSRTYSRESAGVSKVAIGPDGRLAVLRSSGPVEIWDVDGGVDGPVAWIPVASPREVRWEPDGTLAVADARARTVWSVPVGVTAPEVRGEAGVSTLRFDGDDLLIGAGRGGVRRVDAHTGRVRTEYPSFGSAVKGLAIRDGVLYQTVGGDPGVYRHTVAGDALARWGAAGLRGLGVVDGDLIGISYVLEPDLFAFGLQGEDVALDCPEHEWVAIAAAPNRRAAALLGADGTLELLSARTCHPSEPAVGAHSMDLADDGAIALVDDDGVWFRGAHTWRSALENATDVAISPDSALVAVGAMDGSTRLFDAGSGALLAVLGGHEERVSALAFRADGQVLATGSWDRSVRQWPLARLRADPRVVLDGFAQDGYPPVERVLDADR